MSDQDQASTPVPAPAQWVATVPMQVMVCMRCGTPFALPAYLYSRCLHVGAKFHCPNGHKNQYLPVSQQVEMTSLQAELQKTRQEVAELKGRLVDVTARNEHLEAVAASVSRVPAAPEMALATTTPAALGAARP